MSGDGDYGEEDFLDAATIILPQTLLAERGAGDILMVREICFQALSGRILSGSTTL